MSKKPTPKKKQKPASKPATRSRVMPKSEAKPLATKKTAPVVDDAPMPQAVSKPKPHARKSKKSEEDKIAKGKRLAASYLVQRDGMDEDTAATIVDSMDADTINVLISESATSILDRSADAAQSGGAGETPGAPATSPAATPEKAGEEDAGIPARDFLEIPELAGNETFAELAIRCRDKAVEKNAAEKMYKADKKTLDSVLSNAGVDKLEPVMCFGVRLVRYSGKSPRQLSEIKLMEAGVSPDVIAKCWVQGTYDDVRVTTPEA